ncbi:unnamed protein product, partial [Effrenium voratum]
SHGCPTCPSLRLNLFNTRAEALAYYIFMISSERVYTQNLQRAHLVRYYISADNLMHYWSFFVRNWISPTCYLDANEVYNLPVWGYWCICDFRQLVGMAIATPADPVSTTNERQAQDAAVMALRHIAGYYGLALLNL